MNAIGAIVGTTSVVAAVGGEFLTAVSAVSLGITAVLAALLLVLAIGSWDELDAANGITA